MMIEAGVECRGCHENKDGTITKVTAIRCVNCHDDSYVKVLEEWQTEVKGKVDRLAGTLAALTPDILPAELHSEYDRLTRTVEVLREDRSYGGHNYMNVTALLDDELAAGDELRARAEALP